SLEDRARRESLELVERARSFPRLPDGATNLQAAHPARQEAVLGEYPRDIGLWITLEAIVVAERRVAVDAQSEGRVQFLAEGKTVLREVADRRLLGVRLSARRHRRRRDGAHTWPGERIADGTAERLAPRRSLAA